MFALRSFLRPISCILSCSLCIEHAYHCLHRAQCVKLYLHTYAHTRSRSYPPLPRFIVTTIMYVVKDLTSGLPWPSAVAFRVQRHSVPLTSRGPPRHRHSSQQRSSFGHTRALPQPSPPRNRRPRSSSLVVRHFFGLTLPTHTSRTASALRSRKERKERTE